MNRFKLFALLCLISALQIPQIVHAEDAVSLADTTPRMDVLTEQQWTRLDDTVDRALRWLASEQQRDGSFPTLVHGQPGVTSLVLLAFAAHGHLPGSGPYGEELSLAVDYVLSCQKPSGILALVAPGGAALTRSAPHEFGVSASYNHAIGSLSLSELYTIQGAERAKLLQSAIEKSLAISLTMQSWPKQREIDRGGWRYLHKFREFDSDLSLTGWHLMFLRSAKNAGFDVAEEPIDEAVGYIRRCFRPDYQSFNYIASQDDRRSRGVSGAGVLALAHAGYHNSEEAQKTGDWILRYNFDRYNQVQKFNQSGHHKDRYHYGVFHCCQAMYQLGGRHWEQFFPSAATTLISNQRPDGSWPAESNTNETKYGNCYTSALVLLALGAPNQLLPVFQR